ncbi:MAG: glycosyltransferase [Chloroflexi bacterium]|nr:glycosyltransferase [Chloroflexota bacterium]MBM3166936.1 glycosyltransferase [Chloroflexota bacterium]
MRILILSLWNPYPPDLGAKLRNIALLQGWSRRHQVSLLTFSDEQGNLEASLKKLHSLCVDVQFISHSLVERALWRRIGNRLNALGSNCPIPVVLAHSHQMAQAARSALQHSTFDAVQIDSPWMYQYVPAGLHITRILNAYNIEFEVMKQRARVAANPLRRAAHQYDAAVFRRYELAVMRRCQFILASSENDRQRVTELVHETQVVTVPNALNLEEYSWSAPDACLSKTLVFTGTMSYPPNVDGVLYFYTSIYPLIQAQIPEVQLAIVGREPTTAIRGLARDPSIRVTGYVEDVKPLIRRSCVFIAPIRFGGGTRIKLLEAMALGVPVVTTNMAAEGLDVQDGRHVLIADNPATFAEKTILLLDDSNLRRRLAYEARQLVETRYSWRAVEDIVTNLFPAF